MKFGTSIMGVSFRSYPEVAAAFEESGFESIWIPEHLVFPAEMPPTYPYSDSGYPPVTPDTPAYDPWVVLSYIAASTHHIRLATNIYILPLRHPLQTARSVVTLDRVSGGRVTLGIGVGWLEDEFNYLGLNFAIGVDEQTQPSRLSAGCGARTSSRCTTNISTSAPSSSIPSRYSSPASPLRSVGLLRPPCAGPGDWATDGSRSDPPTWTNSGPGSRSWQGLAVTPVEAARSR